MEAAKGPQDTEPLLGEKKVSKTSHRFGMMLHGLWFILFLALSLYAHDISVQLNQDVKKLRTDLVKLGNEAAAQRAAIQADVDGNEVASNASFAAAATHRSNIQADVDGNEVASNATDAAIQADITTNTDAIATNTDAIATNTADIATNTANISNL